MAEKKWSGNDKEENETLVLTSRVPIQRLQLKKKISPYLTGIFREDPSVGSSKKMKKIRGKRLRQYWLLLTMCCVLQGAVWMDVKSRRRMGDGGRRGVVPRYVVIQAY